MITAESSSSSSLAINSMIFAWSSPSSGPGRSSRSRRRAPAAARPRTDRADYLPVCSGRKGLRSLRSDDVLDRLEADELAAPGLVALRLGLLDDAVDALAAGCVQDAAVPEPEGDVVGRAVAVGDEV